MFNKLFSDHVVDLRRAFFRKLKPKLKVLPKLGPAFRDSRWDECE